MNDRAPRKRPGGRREEGHLMAGLMAAIAIMLIFSTMAFQAWEDVLRRDNEAEMIFRAQDLVRAIQRYRKDHGGLGPEKLEDLIEPGPKGQYYLRVMYTDPLVKDGAWGLLYAGPGGTLVDPTAMPVDGSLPGSGLGSGGTGLGGGRSRLSSALDSKSGRTGERGRRSGSQANSQIGGASGSQEIGGLRIAGVKSLSTDPPFRLYKNLTQYSEWLFSYFDLENAQVPGANRPGGPGGQQGGPGRRGGIGPNGQRTGPGANAGRQNPNQNGLRGNPSTAPTPNRNRNRNR